MRRIGQILSQSVPLSEHDVAEILEEQKVSRQRFGDAAMALGLANPQQVWQAWVDQLQSDNDCVDLTHVQFDPQALRAMHRDFATIHRVLPLRMRDDELVVATAEHPSAEMVQTVESHCHKRCIFVHASERDLAAALLEHYAPAPSAAA